MCNFLVIRLGEVLAVTWLRHGGAERNEEQSRKQERGQDVTEPRQEPRVG